MQFWDYFTHFQWAKGQPGLRHDIKGMDAAAFYGWYLGLMDSKSRASTGLPIERVDPFTPALLALERKWTERERPYYNLWPGIVPCLSKLRMDADASHFRLPLDELLLRFPKGEHPLHWEHGGKRWEVRTVLCENSQLVRDRQAKGKQALLVPEGAPEPETVRGLTFWIDAGEDETPGGSVRDALWPSSSGDYLDVAGLGFVSLTTQAPGAISIGDAEFLAVEHTLTMIVRRT